MGIKKIVSRMLPESKIKSFRHSYYMFRQKLHRPMSVDFFKNILTQRLGIQKGDTLFIHSSVDFLNIDFSPIQLIQILKDVIGEEGTLLFPAWHVMGRAEEYLKNPNHVFDMKRSPAVLGLLPELARRMPGAQRSAHPINSIVALGRHAAEIVSGHEDSIYPAGESSPYYKMLLYHAKIIGLGVNANFLSFVHCPEDLMGQEFPVRTRTEEIFTGKVKLMTGETIDVKTLAAHSNIQKRNIPGFLKKHVSKTIFSVYRIQGSDFYVADANALFDRMCELARQNITIYTS